MFQRLLRACGLALVVVDSEGAQVAPFPADAVRDNAGRRFPAHLDLRPPDDLPDEAMTSPRYDRAPVRAWYHRRAERDRRAAAGTGRTDHATAAELELHRLRRLYGRTPWWPEREAAIERRLGLGPGAAPGAD
jgi:HTH-type transcriptional regulator/antitoxin HipB